MSRVTEQINVRLLVNWLGAEGASAGLRNSRKYTVDTLARIANDLGIEVDPKPKRNELIDEVVRIASKRIDKPVESLASMGHDELVRYFEEIEVESSELLDLLKQLDLNPGREGRRNLLEFVARELSETGRFMRIVSRGKSDSGG
jgi:transcriptional regulator with XRE-family HTH domain